MRRSARSPAASACAASTGWSTAVRYAREKGMPFFGICLGMQVASIEFARNKCGLEDSHSSEFAPECGNPVISLMESQQHVTDMGGTMRLGAYPARLKPGIARRAHVRRVGCERAASASLRVLQRVSRSVRAQRRALQRALARWLARGDDRDPRSSVVRGLPVPSGAQVASDSPASALRRLHRRGRSRESGARR